MIEMLKKMLGLAPKEAVVSEDASVHQSEPEIVATQAAESEVVINDIPVATEEFVPVASPEVEVTEEAEIL